MSCSDHEDHEYHVVTMRFSRWDKEISSWWMPNLTCSPPQEVPRGLTVMFSLSPWGISRSHHEILLVTTRNLLVNQNFYLPPHQKLPHGLAVRFSLSPRGISQSHREILLVTTRNLLVNENFLPTPLPKASSWSRREILFVTTIGCESVAGWKGSCQTVAVLNSGKCVAIQWFSSYIYIKIYDFQIAFEWWMLCLQPDPSIFSTYKRSCCHCGCLMLFILRYAPAPSWSSYRALNILGCRRT